MNIIYAEIFILNINLMYKCTKLKAYDNNVIYECVNNISNSFYLSIFKIDTKNIHDSEHAYFYRIIKKNDDIEYDLTTFINDNKRIKLYKYNQLYLYNSNSIPMNYYFKVGFIINKKLDNRNIFQQINDIISITNYIFNINFNKKRIKLYILPTIVVKEDINMYFKNNSNKYNTQINILKKLVHRYKPIIKNIANQKFKYTTFKQSDDDIDEKFSNNLNGVFFITDKNKIKLEGLSMQGVNKKYKKHYGILYIDDITNMYKYGRSLAHEIYHMLGLEHNKSKGALMQEKNITNFEMDNINLLEYEKAHIENILEENTQLFSI